MGRGKKPDVASTIELSFFSASDNIVLNTGVALKLLLQYGMDVISQKMEKTNENGRIEHEIQLREARNIGCACR